MSMNNAGPSSKTETESEARARRIVHVVGALIVLLTVAIVVWAVFGGAKWAQHRQLRAIQIGARADLELVAEAQKNFFKIHGFYTTDLKALNLWPKRVLYAFGFVAPASFPEASQGPAGAAWDPDLRTITKLAVRRAEDAIAKAKEDPNFKPDPPILLSPMTKVKAIDLDSLSALCPDCTATKTTFKVMAAANLDSDDQLDVWTMDHEGRVVQVQDDLVAIP